MLDLAQANGANGYTSGYTVQTFAASSIPLSQNNVIAVELHTYVIWAWEIHFDMYVAAQGSSCKGPTFFDSSTFSSSQGVKTASADADSAASYADASKTPDASTFMKEAIVESVTVADTSGHHHVARKAGTGIRV